MRDELHLMELVDRYLDGGMGESERAAFEERMRASGELQGLVGDQRALREGLDRVHLRRSLASAHRTWTIKRWVPWLVAGLFVLAAGGWLVQLPAEHDAPLEAAHMQVSEVPNGTDASIPASDSLAGTLDLDTRVETVFMRTVSPVERTTMDSARGEGRIVTRLITEQSEAADERVAVAQRGKQESAAPVASATSPPANHAWGSEDFSLSASKADPVCATVADGDGEKTVLATVERFENATKPEFPGGIEEMLHYIQDNIKQPRGTKKTGTVTVGFTVNKKGEVANAEIMRSLGRPFDAEAMRVITSMPQWEPSRLGERAVKSKVQVRVRFSGAPKKSATVRERR